MSRMFSSPSPRRGGTFRPQLEALEGRFAPGSLFGTSPGLLLEPGDAAAARQREEADAAFVAGLLASQQQGAIISPPTPVVDFATGSIVYGESTLVRTAEGVTAHLSASGLAPGAYTFWMKVDAPGMGPIAGWLAGHVVGEDGILNFSAHVSVGEVLSRNPDFPSGPLQDPLHSKITLVVRYHGPADPGQIYEQTHTHQPGVAFNFLKSIHLPPA
jgi:hypothetical protein